MRTAANLLAACLLAPTLLAQGDFAYDKTSPATMGGALKLVYAGAPASRAMMFMLSKNGGPTPLKLMFGGTDPRSLQVGVDLLPLWLLTATSSTGNGAFNQTVPVSATLQGTHLHLQLMTGPGTGGNVIDKISNKIVIVAGASGSTDLLQARLGDGRTPRGPGRAMMAVFPIANKNGSVMLAGGGLGSVLGASGLQTTEIYDFRSMSVRPGPDMTVPRALNTATVLGDGRVLIAGGVDSLGAPTVTCELYDPKANTFAKTGDMTAARAMHAAALMTDGRVLVVAGTKVLTDPLKMITGILRSCEIYDPAKGTWSATASIKNAVIGPALIPLKSGKILVSGGIMINTFFGIPLSIGTTTSCQLYTPTSGTWSGTGSMKQSRSLHTTNTILLKDGRVLATGGLVVSIPLIPPPTTLSGIKTTDKSEYYNPSTGSWVSLPVMSDARTLHSVTEMPNGRVLVVGGTKDIITAPTSVDSIQEFDPSSNTFVRTFKLKAPRATHGAALMPDGSLIIFGGTGASTTTNTTQTMEIVHQ